MNDCENFVREGERGEMIKDSKRVGVLSILGITLCPGECRFVLGA